MEKRLKKTIAVFALGLSLIGINELKKEITTIKDRYESEKAINEEIQFLRSDFYLSVDPNDITNLRNECHKKGMHLDVYNELHNNGIIDTLAKCMDESEYYGKYGMDLEHEDQNPDLIRTKLRLQ